MARSQCCTNYGLVCHIFLIIMATAGAVLSFLTFFSCDFLQTTTPPIVESLPGFDNFLIFNFGLYFFTDINGECAVYPDDWEFDATALCAQVCSFIAPIFAVIALILYLWEFFFYRFCCARFIQASFLFGALMAQGLTFFAFNSEDFCKFPNTTGSRNSCTISNGAIFSITAFACFFVVGCIGCCTPKPRPLIKRCGNDDDNEDDHEEKGCFGKKKEDDDEPKEDEPKVDDEQGNPNASASEPMLYSAVYE